MLLIERSSDTPIRPRDIDSDRAFFNTFGNRDAEVAAYWIVRYCQARRNWRPFEFDSLVRYAVAHDPRWIKASDLLVDGVSELVVGGFAVVDSKQVTLSTTFVARCYETAPVPGLPRKRRSPRPKVAAKSRLDVLLADEELV